MREACVKGEKTYTQSVQRIWMARSMRDCCEPDVGEEEEEEILIDEEKDMMKNMIDFTKSVEDDNQVWKEAVADKGGECRDQVQRIQE